MRRAYLLHLERIQVDQGIMRVHHPFDRVGVIGQSSMYIPGNFGVKQRACSWEKTGDRNYEGESRFVHGMLTI